MVRIMKTTMTIKIDKVTKEQAQLTAKKLGIPLSTIINAYLREMSATGHVSFSTAEVMTPHLEKLIELSEAEIRRGETYGPFDNAEDFIASLKS
jgi:antitoxin component of RelBE/YafQ-DinJ toxin-antitoxin module